MSSHVIIRVWPPSLWPISIDYLKDFGHVSLQTFTGGESGHGRYISFYPGSTTDPCWHCKKTCDHFHSYEEDVAYLGQAHINNTYTLYNLNGGNITLEFERLEKSGLEWQLLASNCSSLVYQLLIHGGLQVDEWDRSSRGSSTYFPDGVVLGGLTAMIGLFAAKNTIKFTSHLCRRQPDVEYGIFGIDYVMEKGIVLMRDHDILNFYHNNINHSNMFSRFIANQLFRLQKNVGAKNAIMLAAVGVVVTAALGYWAWRTAVNYFTIKPTDIIRIMPQLCENDRLQCARSALQPSRLLSQ